MKFLLIKEYRVNEEEYQLLDIMICSGWGNDNGVLRSPRPDWGENIDIVLTHLIVKYGYIYGGCK